MHSYNLFLLYWLKICTLKITHVSELWVARLRVWDQFRLMLAVNSTLLSDDPGLKHFNAQEWKRSTHSQSHRLLTFPLGHCDFLRWNQIFAQSIYLLTKTWNCTLRARKSQRRQNCVTNISLNTWMWSEALRIAILIKIVVSLAFDQQFRLRNFD